MERSSIFAIDRGGIVANRVAHASVGALKPEPALRATPGHYPDGQLAAFARA